MSTAHCCFAASGRIADCPGLEGAA